MKTNPILRRTQHTPTKVGGSVARGTLIYACDECGNDVTSKNASLMSGSKGTFAYCPECTKKLYPKYRKITLFQPAHSLAD